MPRFGCFTSLAGCSPGWNPNPAAQPARPIPMNPFALVVRAFVNTFGITQPTPEGEARAGRFIALMLAAVLVLLGMVVLLLRAAFVH